MSTAGQEVTLAAAPAEPGTLPALPEAADRGTLSIAEKVVERIAGYAVTRVHGASAAPRRVLGIRVGDPRPEDEAAVDAHVDGASATVRATVAISWPSPVRATAARLRQAIRDDVATMTGVQVAQVDLDVVSLTSATAPSRRVQ